MVESLWRVSLSLPLMGSWGVGGFPDQLGSTVAASGLIPCFKLKFSLALSIKGTMATPASTSVFVLTRSFIFLVHFLSQSGKNMYILVCMTGTSTIKKKIPIRLMVCGVL